VPKRYERTQKRKGHRNGYYRRDLSTKYGNVEDIQVPHVKRSQQEPCMRELKPVFAANSRKEAVKIFKAWRSKWIVEAETAPALHGEKSGRTLALLRLRQINVEVHTHH